MCYLGLIRAIIKVINLIPLYRLSFSGIDRRKLRIQNMLRCFFWVRTFDPGEAWDSGVRSGMTNLDCQRKS
jgi:hypothetical protein